MRIIAGKHRGRKLQFSTNQELRPTKDRIRENVFNIIGPKVTDTHVLDCFSGTGSLGFEALSRGANHCVFVDIDPHYTKKNAELFKDSSIDIVSKPVEHYLELCTQRFDLIFIDPPWSSPEHYHSTLMAISQFDILNPNGWVILEHPKSVSIQYPEKMDLFKEKSYGNTLLTILKGS